MGIIQTFNKTQSDGTDSVLSRARVDVEITTGLRGYETVIYDNYTFNPSGDALTSLLHEVGPAGASLASGKRHAPVLDVDCPVWTEEPDEDGFTRVTFFTNVRKGKFQRAIRNLVLNGDLSAESLQAARKIRKELTLIPFLTKKQTVSVTLTFPYRVTALPSKTEGHFHLLCQERMVWPEAKRLALGLAKAGLVDAQFAAISGQGEFMYVNQPDTRYDTL